MTLVEELERVLKQEQQYLLSGNFTALEQLLKTKTRLADRLAAARLDTSPETYRRLAHRAHHNDALLQSARLGLQSALAHLRDASNPGEQSTYSRTGERMPMSRAAASVTQKI